MSTFQTSLDSFSERELILFLRNYQRALKMATATGSDIATRSYLFNECKEICVEIKKRGIK